MIVREAWPLIIIAKAAMVALVIAALRWDSRFLFALAVAAALLTLFLFFFFRDPDRTVPDGADLLLAPADGRVVAVDTLPSHPFIGGEAIKVSIFLSIWDVHVNRLPTGGVIDYVTYNPGKFLAAYRDKASELNEQTEIGMTAAGGHKVVFKQIAGILARRIICRLREGDQVAAGDRFGMIRFGSRADLIVPAASRIDIEVGCHVKGGETVIGRLPSPVEADVGNAMRGENAQL
jgi:phosphatidylserine decarboxylase